MTGDTTAYGFLWTKETGMQALPPLPGDFASFAININDRGEVVGASLNAEFMIRAFVWRNGVMYDLNTLVPSNSPLYLQTANSINAIGEIVGFGQTADGEVHGFLLTPSGERAPDEQSIARPVVASERARKLVFRRLGIRPR